MDETFSVTLYRYSSERRVTGMYVGNPVITDVTVEKSLTLQATDETQLANMVNIAAADGWRAK